VDGSKISLETVAPVSRTPDRLVSTRDVEAKLAALLADSFDHVSPSIEDRVEQDSGKNNELEIEKIGFEADAVVSSDQWPSNHMVVVRRLRRPNGEVRRLLLDESTPGAKRELRTSHRRGLGFVRSKLRRSPLLRLRSVINLRTATLLTDHRSPAKLVARRKIIAVKKPSRNLSVV
jgi:hypothetical protein